MECTVGRHHRCWPRHRGSMAATSHMTRLRSTLLVAVVVNALVALVLLVSGTPMPGWFATVLVLVSLALVFSRGIGHSSDKPKVT